MERGSAAPPPFLTTPTLDIILYPPCDPLPPTAPFLLLLPPNLPTTSGERPVPRVSLYTCERRRYSGHVYVGRTPPRGTIQCPRFARRSPSRLLPSGRRMDALLSPKGILADSFQFRNRFRYSSCPNVITLLLFPD